MAENHDAVQLGPKIALMLRSEPCAGVAALKVANSVVEQLADAPVGPPQSGGQGYAVSSGSLD
jgi:hypothetical protein